MTLEVRGHPKLVSDAMRQHLERRLSATKRKDKVMKGSSFLKVLGCAVVGVAVGAFTATTASAEPPSHGFNSRPPRLVVDRKPAPHKPHVAHKVRSLHPGAPNDKPPHKTVTRPPRLIVQPPVITPRPKHIPERLVVVKRPHEIMPHAPHVNRRPLDLVKVLPPKAPHKAHKQGRPVPQVPDNKAPVRQELVIAVPK